MEVNLDELDLPQGILAPCHRHGIHTSVDLYNYSLKDRYFFKLAYNDYIRRQIKALNEGLSKAVTFDDVIKVLCDLDNVR